MQHKTIVSLLRCVIAAFYFCFSVPLFCTLGRDAQILLDSVRMCFDTKIHSRFSIESRYEVEENAAGDVECEYRMFTIRCTPPFSSRQDIAEVKYDFDFKKRRAFLEMLCVAREYRGIGIGSALLNGVKNNCVYSQLHELKLLAIPFEESTSENIYEPLRRLILFYEKNGFRKRFCEGNGPNRQVMKCNLSNNENRYLNEI